MAETKRYSLALSGRTGRRRAGSEFFKPHGLLLLLSDLLVGISPAQTPSRRAQKETLFFLLVFLLVSFQSRRQEPSIHAGYSPFCDSCWRHHLMESGRVITPQNPRSSSLQRVFCCFRRTPPNTRACVKPAWRTPRTQPRQRSSRRGFRDSQTFR